MSNHPNSKNVEQKPASIFNTIQSKDELMHELFAQKAICYVYAFDVEDLSHVYHANGTKPTSYTELFDIITTTCNPELYWIDNDDTSLIGNFDYLISPCEEYEGYVLCHLESYLTFAQSVADSVVDYMQNFHN